MNKYLEFVKIEFQQGLKHRGATIGRFGFYGVVLFVFSQLWKVVATKSSIQLSSIDMLWYLAMTELIVLSFPLVHLEIEEDVRSGNLAYFLVRPYSYLGARYARAVGSLLSRYLILVGAGVVFAYLFSGGWPSHPSSLWIFVPLSLLSCLVGLVFHVMIGVISFWIQDCSPIYWVWQKLGFVLGGMIFPLDIYPEWLQSIAFATPFSAFLYEPAMAALRADYGLAGLVVLKLAFWWLVAVSLVSCVFVKARQGLAINGG